jgi:hypothetical protein
MGAVTEILVVGTLYSTFCAFLLFPHLGAPQRLVRGAIALCALQFVCAIGWNVSRQNCGGMRSGDAVFTQPCSPMTTVLAYVSAVLAAGFFIASAAHAARALRRWRHTAHIGV